MKTLHDEECVIGNTEEKATPSVKGTAASRSGPRRIQEEIERRQC